MMVLSSVVYLPLRREHIATMLSLMNHCARWVTKAHLVSENNGLEDNAVRALVREVVDTGGPQ
jgi:hypothetical protein